MKFFTSCIGSSKVLLLLFFPLLSYAGVALLLTPHIIHAAGTTYHVQQNGGGDCTTISACLGRLQSGDTLTVHDGTYEEADLDIPAGATVRGTSMAGVLVRTPQHPTGGSWGAVIGTSYSNVTLSDMTIEGPYAQRGIASGGTNNVFERLEIRYVRGVESGESSGIGIAFTDPAGQYQGNTIRNVIVRRTGYYPDNSPNPTCDLLGCHGTYIAGTDNLVDGLQMYDNNGFGIMTYFGSGGADNNTIRNSISARNRFDGISTLSGKNSKIYNNLSFDNEGAGISSSNPNSNIMNNIVYGNAGDGIWCRGIGSVQVTNNIVWQDNISECNDVSNNLTSDPLFVNPSGGDFHISSNSPARDAGATLPEVPCDFDGNARPAGSAYDIGAYEYGSSPGGGCSGSTSSPTPAPTNQPPAITISAIPSSISVVGQGTTLSWSTTNATSCSASGGWSGSKALGGTTRFTPTGTTIYTLTCTGPGGTGQGSATVTVGQSTACTLYTSSSQIPQGFGVPWDVQNPSIMLLGAACTPPTVLLKAGDSNTTKTVYVYKTAYVAPSGASSWTPVDLFGSNLISGSWYKPFAQGVAQIDSATPNYFVAYTCQWIPPTSGQAGKWLCGCRDSACSQSYWQIQKVQP